MRPESHEIKHLKDEIARDPERQALIVMREGFTPSEWEFIVEKGRRPENLTELKTWLSLQQLKKNN